MNLSLRDQLLAAGLVSSKQAKQAEQQKRQQAKRQPPSAADEQRRAEQRARDQAQAAKVARDQDLNRQRREQRELQARLNEIRQLVEQHRLPPVQSDEYFNFVHKNKVRRIAVDAAMREAIANGKVFIVRYGGFYAPVPAEIAERVRERHAASVVSLEAPQAAAPAEDDPYKNFTVPDDLIW